MKALVIGATGAVGQDLVDLLLKDDSFGSVTLITRRPVRIQNPKLKVHLVYFDNIKDWSYLVQGDVLFSCLGTTIKAAGSQQAQWKVDYTYQYEIAKAARENGVGTYVLVSAVNASPDSKFFYNRMKGELEEAVKKLGFPRCFILQPSSLIRKGSDRLGERIGVAALKAFNAVGLMKDYRPVPTETVAKAMVQAAKSNRTGTEVIVSQEINNLV